MNKQIHLLHRRYYNSILFKDLFKFYENDFFNNKDNYIYSSMIHSNTFLYNKISVNKIYKLFLHINVFIKPLYTIKNIIFKKIKSLKIFILYQSKKIINGYIILICDNIKKIAKIIDLRSLKSFFIKKNTKKEKKEIYLFNKIISIARRNNMKKIYIIDQKNYYDFNKDSMLHFVNIHNQYKKSSWFIQKLGFRNISLKEYKKIDTYLPIYHYLVKYL